MNSFPATWPRSSEGTPAAPGAAAGVAPGVATNAADDIEPYLGHYLATESKTRSFALRVGSWFGAVDVVRMGGDEIGVAGLGPFHRIGSYLYEDAKGRRMAFAELPVGRFVAIGLSPGVFRKTTALESPLWTLPLLLAATLGLVSVLGAAARPHTASPAPACGGCAHWLPIGACGPAARVAIRRPAKDRRRSDHSADAVALGIVLGGVHADLECREIRGAARSDAQHGGLWPRGADRSLRAQRGGSASFVAGLGVSP